jgi:Tol biopolymer transport system component
VADYAVSDSGTLTFVNGDPIASKTLQKEMMWLSADGKVELAWEETREFAFVALSKTGRRLAVSVTDKDTADIWTLDFSHPVLQRLTTGNTGRVTYPLWSSDEAWVYFGAERNGKWGIFRKRADFQGEVETVLEGDTPRL